MKLNRKFIGAIKKNKRDQYKSVNNYYVKDLHSILLKEKGFVSVKIFDIVYPVFPVF